MDDARAAWTALNLVLAYKRKLATLVLARFADPIAIFRASASDLSGLGLGPETARRLFSPETLDRGRRELEAAEAEGFRVIAFGDEAYPQTLRELFDPPLVLYVLGQPDVLTETSLAVVGARQPSAYGRAIAEDLSREAARRGLAVVSGMACGIDTQAHWGALHEGRTIAVLGSGLDVIYPALNRPLARKIAERGAVITEYPLGSKPLGFHFPLRNRIISGLSLAVVVVEATLRSGSLITARLALEQNRDVMAVPGSPASALAAGTNWLIQCGARLVARWEDVESELPDYVRVRLVRPEEAVSAKRPDLGPEEAAVLEALRPDAPLTVDDLVEATDFSVSELLAILLGLELKGAIVQSPGKKYLRRC